MQHIILSYVDVNLKLTTNCQDHNKLFVCSYLGISRVPNDYFYSDCELENSLEVSRRSKADKWGQGVYK